MACGACGGKRQGVEYRLDFKDGSPSVTVGSLAEARLLLEQHGGGTRTAVPKPKK